MVTTRLSSSSSTSSVFSDGGSTKTSVEKKVFSPSVVVHDSFLENSRNLGSEKDFDAVPVRQGSSSEDLDKPRPPVRFSHSKVLTSFRSSKKPAYQATSSGPSTVYDIRDERLESAPENVYNHIRSQSLPSSKIVAVNVTSKSWMEDRENNLLSLGSEEPSRDQRLPRSSSISRAQTTRVSALHQDDAKSLTHQSKNNFGNYRGEAHSAVIRAMKTEVPFESANKTNTELRSKSTPFLPQDDRNERDKTRTELAVPVLKENSIMQRLLIESQGQGEPRMRSKAAAIKEEITQRTDNTDTATKQTVIKTESVPTVEQQRLVHSNFNVCVFYQ